MERKENYAIEVDNQYFTAEYTYQGCKYLGSSYDLNDEYVKKYSSKTRAEKTCAKLIEKYGL